MSEQSGFGAFNPGAFANPFQMVFGSLDTVAQNMSPMMGPMKAMAQWQLETMGFMNRRAQAYMEIPSRLSRCRTPQDLMSEQMRFWHVRPDLAKVLRSSGLEPRLGIHRVFHETTDVDFSSTLEAVRHAYDLLAGDLCSACPRRGEMGRDVLYYMI